MATLSKQSNGKGKVQGNNVDTADDSINFRFENPVGLVMLRRERETFRFMCWEDQNLREETLAFSSTSNEPPGLLKGDRSRVAPIAGRCTPADEGMGFRVWGLGFWV